MKVRIDGCRIAFCSNLFTRGGQYARHDAQFIIDPKSPAVKLLDAGIEQVAKEKWKERSAAVLAKVIKDGGCCFLKADYEDKNGEVYDGFEGMYALGASSKKRPLIIDRDKTQLSESDGRPYAGCYVNAQIDLWAQDNDFGRRINAQLSGVQFVRDGDAFTGRRPADPEDFEDLADQGEMADDLVD